MEQYFQPGDRIGVLTAEPLGRVLDYLAPEGGCLLGAFVEVPLGPRKIIGVVWGAGDGQFDVTRLRRVIKTLDVPPMRAELRTFLTRVGDYTLTPLSAMMRLATRVSGLAEGGAMAQLYQLAEGGLDGVKLTPARQKVVAVLQSCTGLNMGLNMAEISARCGVGTSVVKGLVQQGIVVKRHEPRDAPYPYLNPAGGAVLMGDQVGAMEELVQTQQARGYKASILKGVTGSGKTEVYLEAVAQCLRQGQQALVLLPEIALTAEFLDRVEKRFGARPAEWHSAVTQAQRRRLWKMLAQGQAQMVVGARSALFLPFQNLGLIVVDEEHDSSYKQEEGVIYNARDMAVLRGAICGCQVVLASATPSLETWVNADTGKYRRINLSARYGKAQLPDIDVIDMRVQKLPSNRWISAPLQNAITKACDQGEQALIFLNRRGYAPVTLCRACGQQVGCRHCDARMVEHRAQNRLICHQCGWSQPVLTLCPACGGEGRLTALGPGVERLADEAKALWPDARVALLASDAYGSAQDLKAQIQAIAGGQADIVIGTQIVAKGHNFPKLTLVGVIDADLGLQGSDLRAPERSFQLIRQVAGRAGRTGEKQGLALLQSYQPDHPVIRAIVAGEDDAFWRAQALERAGAAMPPFGRLAGVILSGPQIDKAFEFGHALARNDGPLRQIGAVVYGPAPAPIARIRGMHRVRLLVKSPKTALLQQALKSWMRGCPVPKGVKMVVDIDPQSFM